MIMRLVKRIRKARQPYDAVAFREFYDQVARIMAEQAAREIDTRGTMYARNIYIDLEGVIRPLPFNGGNGIWHFDGQVFFRCKVFEVNQELTSSLVSCAHG